MKFGLGLSFRFRFWVLAYGSMGIDTSAAAVVRSSMFWLIAAYLFHTLENYVFLSRFILCK
jgi:POT family proton-dependent oligopeptide transporter